MHRQIQRVGGIPRPYPNKGPAGFYRWLVSISIEMHAHPTQQSFGNYEIQHSVYWALCFRGLGGWGIGSNFPELKSVTCHTHQLN